MAVLHRLPKVRVPGELLCVVRFYAAVEYPSDEPVSQRVEIGVALARLILQKVGRLARLPLRLVGRRLDPAFASRLQVPAKRVGRAMRLNCCAGPQTPHVARCRSLEREDGWN